MSFESDYSRFKRILPNGKKRTPIAVFSHAKDTYINEIGKKVWHEPVRIKVTKLQERFNNLSEQGIVPDETKKAMIALRNYSLETKAAKNALKKFDY